MPLEVRASTYKYVYDNHMSDKGEWRKLRQQLVTAGCRIEGGGDKHFKVFRGKELVTTLPTSPGRNQGLRNKRAELKRKGLLT